ncbi:hypothetical protein MJO29_002249, partial [Puccinia striiformis f. sp. tritici]
MPAPDKIHKACLKTGVFLYDWAWSTTLRPRFNHLNDLKGYQRKGDNVTQGKPDWHEAIDLYTPSPFGDQEGTDQVLSGHNKFPPRPVNFRSVVENWVDRMCSLGLVVMRATTMGLGLDSNQTKNLLDQVWNSFWVLQCIGYPPLPSTHDGVSCGAHKDYGCFTFLHADSTRGSLQVYVAREEGGHGQEPDCHWIEANPVEGAFEPQVLTLLTSGYIVVNIGEMWETWTNRLYKATLHRVIYKSDNDRV